MKLVIDTNVWISALVFGGNPRLIFELLVKNGHHLIVSEQLFTEIRRKLMDKFPDFLDDFEALRTVLALYSVEVKLGKVTIKKSRDPDDDYLLEMAEISQADLIISGDKDLLSFEKYKKTIIRTPTEALLVINS